mgnify:CR=1 FL=1
MLRGRVHAGEPDARERRRRRGREPRRGAVDEAVDDRRADEQKRRHAEEAAGAGDGAFDDERQGHGGDEARGGLVAAVEPSVVGREARRLHGSRFALRVVGTRAHCCSRCSGTRATATTLVAEHKTEACSPTGSSAARAAVLERRLLEAHEELVELAEGVDDGPLELGELDGRRRVEAALA